MQQPLVVQGPLIIEVSRSHSGTPFSVGILWTSDQLVAETSTWQHRTLIRDRLPCHQRDFFFIVSKITLSLHNYCWIPYWIV